MEYIITIIIYMMGLIKAVYGKDKYHHKYRFYKFKSL